jgi:putative (di)nucleoside polyphosphate hydrolase
VIEIENGKTQADTFIFLKSGHDVGQQHFALPSDVLREKIVGISRIKNSGDMIDEQGYRPNVGIVLCNDTSQVLWAKRCGGNGWQFPQGGMHADETPEAAMYRELHEEVGLLPAHVAILGRTRDWLRYDIPDDYRRRLSAASKPEFRGQKQIWFLLRLTGGDDNVHLNACQKPEFDEWRWIDYWRPLDEIISFKREVYRQALTELETYLGVAAGR